MKHQQVLIFNETKPIGVDYRDIQEVQAYDRRMNRIRDVRKECAEIIDLLDLPPSSRILELGTGTGVFSIHAAKTYKQVIAVDVSATMLGLAAAKAQEEGIDNIEFRQAGFLTYDHQGEQVDGVVTQLALHHLPDFWKLVALRRIYQLLRSGGMFYLRDIVFSFPVDNCQQFFSEWVAGIRRQAGEELAIDTEMSIREEYYTLDWIMEGLLTRAGFTIRQALYHDGFMAVYCCEK